MVLGKIQPNEYTSKLGPKWKGSFRVVRRLSTSIYYLRDAKGKVLQRLWNIFYL